MGEISKIQWTDATWNPWHGCKKVSDGCKYCYMYRDKERYGQDPTNVLRSKGNFLIPLKWNEPRLIFTCSWSDFFIKEADAWRKEAWAIIKATPQHTYQILTKRPERIKQCLPSDWGNGYPNVWLGISAENQEQYDRRYVEIIPIPAVLKFISLEPLLDRIKLCGYNHQWDGWNQIIDWVIIGGESGNKVGKYKYRACQLDWFHDILDQCVLTKVFVKQLGTYIAEQLQLKDRHGGDISEWTEDLQIRLMPKKCIEIKT